MTGPTRRRTRLTDKETEERMLTAAVDMVGETGLTVSLEHLSFEDVIRRAGVARSAVYRRWPYKDLFFSDLLRELSKGAVPAEFGSETSVREVAEAVSARLYLLATPEGRHRLLSEVVRANRDFETVRHSTAWRSYLALHATFLSLEDGPLRDDVREALTAAEHGFVTRIADAHRQFARLLGYRIRPEVGAGFETLATLLNAALRGMLLMEPTIPGLSSERIEGRPFGAVASAEWSPSALALGAIEWTFLEPDPDVVWNEKRVAEARDALERIARGD
ncbi:TetR/AcrR family transcriptional regulator [Glycomyces salinus]|uniref:TetR/AcrR family transcriptional regulator n=1 Tax=Glycomyces salinus TaxID=980294 RepID=UPI0018EC469F|nr:TetR/AcrR family transcriptional regulator [Glycomyces salinus]